MTSWRRAITASGDTIAQAAARIGLPKRTLEQWLAGTRTPAASALALRLYRLLTDQDADYRLVRRRS